MEQLFSSLIICREKRVQSKKKECCDTTTEKDNCQGLQTGTVYWNNQFFLMGSHFIWWFLPSCWTFCRVREASFPLLIPWRQRGRQVSIVLFWEQRARSWVLEKHFFSVRAVKYFLKFQLLPPLLSRTVDCGGWRGREGQGAILILILYLGFKLPLTSPEVFVLENSICFPWNKGFWKAGRPSWQRPVWGQWLREQCSESPISCFYWGRGLPKVTS